jgi:diguanylate cyclase
VPVGVEALARWEHPRRGLLGPAEFLEHAERDPELIAGVTRTTLNQAVRDCAAWYRDGRDLPVAVNIAAPMLLGGPLIAAVNAALRRHDLPPHLLTLEITESAIMLQGPEAAGVLAELRAIGVRVSLDDFGTGYSSLARLRTFPLDELKIDRSFVQALVTDERVLPLVELVVTLGKNFGLTVVAEGVEDPLSLAALRSVGCSVAQGFFFSAALPERDLLAWLDSYRPLARSRKYDPARLE